jgi:V/A-type H+/Na+-transporting ATPase subunit I
MAVLKMKRIEIVALHRDAKNVIRLLQREGVVEVTSGDSSESFLHANGQSSRSVYEEHRNTALLALKTLDEYSGFHTSMLDSYTGRTELSEETFTEFKTRSADAIHMAGEIENLRLRIETETTALRYTRQMLEKYLPWESLDIPMAYAGSKHTTAFIGSLPGEYTAESLAAALSGSQPSDTIDSDSRIRDADHESLSVETILVSATREMTCAVILCHKSDEDKCRTALRALGFVLPADPTTHPPALRLGRYRERIRTAEATISDLKAKIASYAPQRDELLFLIDYMSMKIERYDMLKNVLFSRRTVVIEGFCPDKYTARVKNLLEKGANVYVEIREPEAGEEVPVLLQNNTFVSPVEDVTASYSLPGPGEADPNPVMAFFYYLFFGMMLSDAAYGVLIVLGALYILIFRKPEGLQRKNLLKFLYCGMSTILWGSLFGSWFGNVVYIVSGTFFGHTLSLDPIWFDPVKNPLLLLIVSMALGFVHILAGMGIKFYTLWKNGHRGDAIMDVGFWWIVFAGILTMLAAMVVPSMPILQTVGMWTAIAGAAGLLATQGRSSPHIPGKIMGGIASLYSITGYFSDILSYSRLMALGLVTGIIASVVNTIGSIGGKSVGGVLIFIVVFLFGHAINIGINALGAYVHGNRLQYVEFFGKFYEGGGRPFKPFSMKMKHYKLKEDK